MARQLRLSIENGFYHIMSRGIRKENIFYSDRDKSVFIDKMNETFEKYSFICYAFCLMDNHYHLFIKTQLANISKGMHYLNSSYANWFRRKYELEGAIFQGRFKSILVDSDKYALSLSTYIHLNPLRGNLVKNLKNYKYSSFLDYIGEREYLIYRLDTSLILGRFSSHLRESQILYDKFVNDNKNMDSPLDNTLNKTVLGSIDFLEGIRKRRHEKKEVVFSQQYKANDILAILTNELNIKIDILFKRTKNNIYRNLAQYLLRKYTQLTLKEIGDMFDVNYTAISVSIKRFKQRIDNNKEISEIVKRIEHKIEQ
ncbi:MAG: chromosomal replication initiator DnaA [Proteobacteria bacterium]|nr:chromosomal replication initiator DnaA [Pseudomonadota bacterium]